MAAASARLSEAGRRKRADLRVRQQQRGPAPLASFEDISVDRSTDVSLDMEEVPRLSLATHAISNAVGASGGSSAQQLTLPSPRIQVSKASSSASDESRNSTPERDLLKGCFSEESTTELRASTDELGAPEASVRKDSVSSAGSELILPASGRSSRLSSLCSTMSGRRSVSPYRTMLETSFCGCRPLVQPDDPPSVPDLLPSLNASNGPRHVNTTQPERSSPLMSPPAFSPPVERRACTLPPGQPPPVDSIRKASLGQVRRAREESLSPAKTPDSPCPRRKSSFSRLLREARRELRERSRSRSKSKEPDDGKGSILSLFKRKQSASMVNTDKKDLGGSDDPASSPSLENRLEEEINKVEFKFYEGETIVNSTPVVASTIKCTDTNERKGPEEPVVQNYTNVMKELNSALGKRLSRPNEASPPALPLKSPNRHRRDFGSVSIDHDQPRQNQAVKQQPILTGSDLNTELTNALIKRNTAVETIYSRTGVSEPASTCNPANVEHAPRPAPAQAEEADAVETRSVRSVRSSGSDKESSAADQPQPDEQESADIEAAQLFQGESDEDELPYVPTTLPQERPLQKHIVPIQERSPSLRSTSGVERPHSAKSVTPADIDTYVQEVTHRSTPPSSRVRILIPQDSLKLIRTPKRMTMKSWSQFAHEGLQSPRLRRRDMAVTETSDSGGSSPRLAVRSAPSLVEEESPPSPPTLKNDTVTPVHWVRVNEIPEPAKKPKKLSAGSPLSGGSDKSNAKTDFDSPPKSKSTHQRGRSETVASRRRRDLDESRRRSDPIEPPKTRRDRTISRSDNDSVNTPCECCLSLHSGSSEQELSGSCRELPRSPAEIKEVEYRRDEIQTRLGGASGALVHKQTAALADTLEDATLTYFQHVRDNTPEPPTSARSTSQRKDSYGNELTVERPGSSRHRSLSGSSVKSRSPSPHKLLIETSFCGSQPLPVPDSFEVDDLVDISQLPSETGSLHTDTDSSGRQSRHDCHCRCHSDAELELSEEQEEDAQEHQEKLSRAR